MSHRKGVAVVHRVLQLSVIPAGSLAGALEGWGRRALGQPADDVTLLMRQRSADRLRRVLGEARGGALKAGQLLSTVEALFPVDPEDTWRAALADLPADNRPEPFEVVEPVLRTALGPNWRERFTTFDQSAAAAASIGQVHRATTAAGQHVAVKIQYPDVADALRTDLGIVSAMTRLGAAVAPSMALPPLAAEMRARLAEELDYHREAAVQRAFADAHRQRAQVIVPEVVCATDRVLIMDWLDGVPFTRLHAADQGTRNAAAAAYVEFLLSGPARCGWLHTDPHPGNFLWLPDDSHPAGGRLGVLDFGSALPMPEGMPRTFGRLITLLRAGDPDQTLEGLVEEGFVRPGTTVDAAKLRDYLAPFSEPSRHDVFTFTPEWLRSQFGRLGDPRNPDFAVALQLTMPPEHLFTHRVWLGVVGVLCQLRATIRIGPTVRRWLPGLE